MLQCHDGPLEAAGVPIVRVWNLSLSQWDVHTAGPRPLTGGSEDCTHYCEPSGVLDAWVDATVAALDRACLVDHVLNSMDNAQCVP